MIRDPYVACKVPNRLSEKQTKELNKEEWDILFKFYKSRGNYIMNQTTNIELDISAMIEYLGDDYIDCLIQKGWVACPEDVRNSLWEGVKKKVKSTD